MNKHLKFLIDYFKIIVFNSVVQFVLRLLETSFIIIKFGLQDSLIGSEFVGLLCDLINTNAILLFLYPLYYLLYSNSGRTAKTFFLSLVMLMTVFQIIAVSYFLYQLDLLDTFLYNHSLKEFLFTINTSNTNFLHVFILLTVVIVAIYGLYRFLKKLRYSQKFIFTIYYIVIFALPVLIVFQLAGPLPLNKFSRNKSLYFYKRSFIYVVAGDPLKIKFSTNEAIAYQKMNPGRNYKNIEYPLLHSFDTTNVLKPLLNPFDSAPNIVILIIEGLNDDFIHPYKGVELMPFLSKLKYQCLYWNKCFTQGERSFAAVPSIFGSVPYGEKGFTMLDMLPRHFSLVSVLNSNGYQTSFFDGQASWFHRKDHFFRLNDIGLIFDNHNYSEKYRKIYVGDDNYFWGYNDKDLFNQALEVVDTLTEKPRLDIYFTGTSHSPFIICDSSYYDNRVLALSNKLTNVKDAEFFNTYQKYLKSVIFVDDAIENFFEKYKERREYQNTIFILTGDHPMTEIPVENSLKRYHVPLMIYSPKLKSPQTFSGIACHLDIYESILSFLATYNINAPEYSTAMGIKLNVSNNSMARHFAFMNNNRDIIDYYSNGYFLTDKQLFTVDDNLMLTACSDKSKNEKLSSELELFKKMNLHVCLNNKLLPDSVFNHFFGYKTRFEKNVPGIENFKYEYRILFDSVKLVNKDHYFNISFNYEGKIHEGVSLVNQLSTKNGIMVYSEKTNLVSEGHVFQEHFKIPKQAAVTDSLLFFKSFLYNKELDKISYKDLRIRVYSQ